MSSGGFPTRSNFSKFAGGSVAAAQRQLESMLRSAKSAVIGKHNLSDFVNSDPSQLKFEAIENEIKASVQNELAAQNYGISIEFLGIKKLGLPENVTQTVFDRMKSERQKLINEALFKGEAEATKIKSAAERQAADVIANAQAAATRIEGRRGRGREDFERVSAAPGTGDFRCNSKR